MQRVQGAGPSGMLRFVVKLRALFVFTAILSSLLLPRVASADKRVALVIGNGAYQYAPKLPNPTRDARAVADLFKEAGFATVLARNDTGNLDFKRSLRDLLEAAHDADIAVLFYAGHGIQIGDQNYMVPVDARLAREYDAKDEAISLERMVEALEPAKRLRVVILDACRDNPFVVSMQRRVASRGALTRGLARVEPTQVDTLIAYAAKAGSSATDGEGDRSPFTRALLKHIAEPGLDIRLAFGRVRDEVLKATRGDQEPFVYGSLGGSNISLVPPPAVPKAIPLADVAADYNLVEKINSRMAWEVFINTHKTGILVDLARRKLQVLEQGQTASGSSPKIAALPPAKAPPTPTGEETRAWNAVKDSGDRAAIRRFIDNHRSSPLVTKAQEVLEELERIAREKEVRAAAEREAARKRDEEARRSKAEDDRQKAEREAALTKAAREEAERKRAEKQREAEAEAERKRQAEVEREKAERELALAKAAREKAEAARRKADQEAAQAKATEAAAERKRQAEADRQKAEREAGVAKATLERAEAERQKAEQEAALAKAAETEAERKRQAEAERQKVEREAAIAKAARDEAERKRQAEICSREEKALASLRASVNQTSVQGELARLKSALVCERLRPAVTALEAEVERLRETKAQEAAQVRLAQQELRRVGCFSGSDDGTLQQATKDAIRLYLSKSGRPNAAANVTQDFVDELKRAPAGRCVDTVDEGKGQKTEKAKQAVRQPRRENEEPRKHTKVPSAASSPRVMTGVGF